MCIVSSTIGLAFEPPTLEQDSIPTTTFVGGWQSRHVSEGVDQASGQAVWMGGINIEWHPLLLDLEWIEARGDPFREVAIGLGSDWELSHFCCKVQITHLRFPDSVGCNTWEVSVELESPLTTTTSAYLCVVYDFLDSGGGMVELGLRGNFPSPLAFLTIEPYAEAGINFGYIDNLCSRRRTHTQAGLEFTLALSRNWSATASIHGSRSHSQLRGIGGGNHLWSALGVTLTH
jgi:hypothetical protein